MLLNVETEYNMTIPNDVAMGMKTVGDIIKYVDGLKK
jgi:acyl carrier protein